MGGARGPSGLSRASGGIPAPIPPDPAAAASGPLGARARRGGEEEGEEGEEAQARRRDERRTRRAPAAEAAEQRGGPFGRESPARDPRRAGPADAAFASPGGGRVAVSPNTWRVDEDAVLCALVDEFGGASWDLAAHAIAHRDAADCKDRFRRVAASRAKSISDSASKSVSPTRVTPEVTKALFRQTAEETFPGCEGAPEPATALRAEVRAARGALATAGGRAPPSRGGGGGALLRRRPRVRAATKREMNETRVRTLVRPCDVRISRCDRLKQCLV